MSDRIYAAIDLEMTGLKPGFDEIIEVGIVRCTPEEVIDRWSTLVRPLEMPPLRVQRMTGITPAMLADAPTWDQVEGRVRELLADATLIGHNVRFDESFLDAAGITSSTPSVDTLPLAQILDPQAPSHRLGELCDRYDVELDDAHRALADAEAARQVFLKLSRCFGQLPLDARDALSELGSTGSMFWPPGRVIRQWARDLPRTVTPAAGPARRTAAAGAPERADLPAGSLASLTQAAFASLDDDEFEHRIEQLEMARDVAETLQNGGTLIVEAGTGTGKSLAYIVPAALWALKTGSPVLISTHTINLQQQLEHKDVEFARRLIAGVSPDAADALKATVVKGRDNYLCQQKLDRELSRCADWEDPLLLARAAVWRSITERGDRAELRLPAPMAERWPKLSANNTACLSDRTCEYAMNGACFLLQVQRQAAASHIVIANHALLVRALTSGAITVPDAPVVIIDESHALEDVATDQLSLVMNESWIREPLELGADGPDALARRASDFALIAEGQSLNQRIAAADQSLDSFFDKLAAFVSEYADDKSANEDRVTLTQGARNSNAWSGLELAWEETRTVLNEVSDAVEDVKETAADRAQETSGDDSRGFDSLALDAGILLDDLTTRIARLERSMTEYRLEEVSWAARENRKTGAASVNAAPLSVAEHLRSLWQEKHATVLTGATLATNASQESPFGYLRERLGIEDSVESQYGSPFDYERRCRIYLPDDMIDAGSHEHHDAVADAVRRLAVAAGGRTMVLFRSYSAMNQVARRVRSDLEEAGLDLIRQGRDGSAAAVVDALRNDPRSVVFGVNALWTGVDVPGDALSLLIITRLPFVPPYDPVLKARGEQYDNEFMEFSLPAAVLQFRQGIGRLIRTQTDIGAAVILDGRVVNRRYGKHFLDALPPAPVIRTTVAAAAEDLRDFLPLAGEPA